MRNHLSSLEPLVLQRPQHPSLACSVHLFAPNDSTCWELLKRTRVALARSPPICSPRASAPAPLGHRQRAATRCARVSRVSRPSVTRHPPTCLPLACTQSAPTPRAPAPAGAAVGSFSPETRLPPAPSPFPHPHPAAASTPPFPRVPQRGLGGPPCCASRASFAACPLAVPTVAVRGAVGGAWQAAVSIGGVWQAVSTGRA